jgi:hypothetical protein
MEILKTSDVRHPNAATTAALGRAAPITTHSFSSGAIDDLFRSAPNYVQSAGGLLPTNQPDRVCATSDEFDALIRNALRR